MPRTQSILLFKEIDKDDFPIAGEFGAKLGDLSQAGFPIPQGFVITTHAYFRFLKENSLTTKINHLIGTVDFIRPDSLLQVSSHIKKMIMHADFDEASVRDICTAYNDLSSPLGEALVTIFPSTTAGLTSAKTRSFQPFHNISGESELMLKVKEIWSELFSPEHIVYRQQRGVDHFHNGYAIVVRKEVPSTQSGRLYTVDPFTGDKNTLIIDAVQGLGSILLEKGSFFDSYEVEKGTLTINRRAIRKQIKEVILSHDNEKTVTLPDEEGKKQKISDNQILDLALLGKKLEKHSYFPQEIEWAIVHDAIYILNTKILEGKKERAKQEIQKELEDKLEVILSGIPASVGLASGRAKIIHDIANLQYVSQGDVLVVTQTTPEFLPAMRKAAGIITDFGDRSSHAGITSRQLGIPAVVGTKTATSTIKDGMTVSVNGLTGQIYKGGISKSSQASEQTTTPAFRKTATKLFVTVTSGEEAEKAALSHADGIGLLDGKSILPGNLVHPRKLLTKNDRQKLVDDIATTLEKSCIAFAPRPVLYKISDLTTHEYRKLTGGKTYEQEEVNPLLGYHGALRYSADPQLFLLELEAIKKVRNEKRLKNLHVMLPFVRSKEELVLAKRMLSAASLHRSPTLKLWMSVDVPSNAIEAETFIQTGIDGLAINIEDLATYLLGVDRMNSDVSKAHDEMNPAVLWAVERVIKVSHKHQVVSSLYGPFLTPELIEKLVTWGITGISVLPETLAQVRASIVDSEKMLLERKK